MHSPFLYFPGDRLSTAELTAACLDGHLVAVGDAFMPADAVSTPALRAGTLHPLVGDAMAATMLSAAWVHGALSEPPARHTVRRIDGPRLHHVIHRRLVYGDHPIRAADLQRIGGVWVASPARTLAELVCDGGDHARRVARQMIATRVASVPEACEWLESAGPIHRKRPALRTLREWRGISPT